MIIQTELSLCDVTAKAEMFLDFDRSVCFWFVSSRAVHHKAKYTNKNCVLSIRRQLSRALISSHHED